MQVYADETTMGKGGMLTLKNLPFKDGEKVEVIVIPRSRSQSTRSKKRHPFWGEPITYMNPTDPVAEDDWDALK